MTRSFFTRPFKTRAWRGIPNYVAITAMLMLAVTIVPGFDQPRDEARMQAPAQPLPAASTNSDRSERVKRKLNVRLSLFRHG